MVQFELRKLANLASCFDRRNKKRGRMETRIMPGTPEWRDARSKCLTASDFAAACGLNPYMSRPALWRKKVNGLITPVNDAMKRGIEDEPKAVEWFKNATGLHVAYPVEFCRSDSYPDMGCTPDALVGDFGLLEVKCPYSVYSDIPIYYLPQIVGQIILAGKWHCYFLAWTPTEQKLWQVYYRTGAWEWMLPYLQEMLRYVTEKKKPPRFKKKPDGREFRELIDYELVGTWREGKKIEENMTLKTTKEQRDELLIDIDDPDVTVYNSVVRDLCHDADEAREFVKELETGRKAWKVLQQQNAELRANLDGVVKHATALLETMQAGEGPDAHYWVEGTWNAEPAYHLRSAIRALKEQEKKG